MLDIGRHDFRVQPPANARQTQPGHFLANHHTIEKVGPDTAVLLTHHGAQKTLLTRFEPYLFGNDTGLLPLFVMRYCLIFEEFAHGCAEGFMVGTEQRTGNH